MLLLVLLHRGRVSPLGRLHIARLVLGRLYRGLLLLGRLLLLVLLRRRGNLLLAALPATLTGGRLLRGRGLGARCGRGLPAALLLRGLLLVLLGCTPLPTARSGSLGGVLGRGGGLGRGLALGSLGSPLGSAATGLARLVPVDVSVPLDFVAGIIAILRGPGSHLYLEWDAMKLAGVIKLHDASYMANGGQLGLSDFDGDRILIVEVEPGEQLAVIIFPALNTQRQVKERAGIVPGRLHLGLGNHNRVPAVRQRGESLLRLVLLGVKIQTCH